MELEEPRIFKPPIHIPLVLLAEFDIVHGSQITQTYPPGILEQFGHKIDGTIVDLMLPEGAQQHPWDFSVFMINRKETSARRFQVNDDDWEVLRNGGSQLQQQQKQQQTQYQKQQQLLQQKEKEQLQQEKDSNNNNSNRPRKPSTSTLLSPKKNKSQKEFLFCYNIIHTKNEKGNVANRGAVIKALAIACTHQFFHIYKVSI
jgi:hypothetical protein